MHASGQDLERIIRHPLTSPFIYAPIPLGPGLVVPASFLVGDVVDFVTRMSKLDRYSSKKTSRSLERIFVTGVFCVSMP